MFQLNASTTQYLSYRGGWTNIAARAVRFLDKWTAGNDFVPLWNLWNLSAELAIVSEPFGYPAVTGRGSPQLHEAPKLGRAGREPYFALLAKVLTRIGQATIEEIRTDICRQAEIVDDNKTLHVLLRLMAAEERGKLRGSVGCAMSMLAMAETIRRAAEHALGTNLPEEDESGFGQWMKGARRWMYGSERLLDADESVRRDFLTGLQLDYGIKVRCYVEGATELGALRSFLGDARGVELIDLHGSIASGGALSFSEHLQHDLSTRVFSVVLLDGDRGDYVRLLRKAATEGKFFGRFQESKPDFEYANFSSSELVGVIEKMCEARDLKLQPNGRLALEGARTAGELFKVARQVVGSTVKKGLDWGEALAKFAVRDSRAERPVIDLARFVVRACSFRYGDVASNYTVDLRTGRLVERS